MKGLDEDLIKLRLCERWGFELPFGWVPISKGEIPADTFIYGSDFFQRKVMPHLRKMISDHYQVTEVIDLIEPSGMEIQSLAECRFNYDGNEHLFTEREFRFVIYATHENVTT